MQLIYCLLIGDLEMWGSVFLVKMGDRGQVGSSLRQKTKVKRQK